MPVTKKTAFGSLALRKYMLRGMPQWTFLAASLLIGANAFAATPPSSVSQPVSPPAPWLNDKSGSREVPPPSGPYHGVPYPSRPAGERQARPAMPPRPAMPAYPSHPSYPAYPSQPGYGGYGRQGTQVPAPAYPGRSPQGYGQGYATPPAPIPPVAPPSQLTPPESPLNMGDATQAAPGSASAPTEPGIAMEDPRAYGVVPPEWRDFPPEGAAEWGPDNRQVQPPAAGAYPAPVYPGSPSYPGAYGGQTPPAPRRQPYVNPYYGYPPRLANPYNYPTTPPQPGAYGPYYGPETGVPGAGERR